MISNDIVRQRESLPFEAKTSLPANRIREWAQRYPGHIAVSFSGGIGGIN